MDPLLRTDAADMLKQAGLPAHYSLHSFRATRITNFLENDGTLEAAQRIDGHADSRTTKPKNAIFGPSIRVFRFIIHHIG